MTKIVRIFTTAIVSPALMWFSGQLTAQQPQSALSAAEVDTAQADPAKHSKYKLIDLGPSTGLAVPGRPLNRRGTLAFGGCGNTDCSIFHTFTWWNDAIIDLGSGLSGGSGPIWISDSGLVLSSAANGLIDPSTGIPEQRGVLCVRACPELVEGVAHS